MRWEYLQYAQLIRSGYSHWSLTPLSDNSPWLAGVWAWWAVCPLLSGGGGDSLVWFCPRPIFGRLVCCLGSLFSKPSSSPAISCHLLSLSLYSSVLSSSMLWLSRLSSLTLMFWPPRSTRRLHKETSSLAQSLAGSESVDSSNFLYSANLWAEIHVFYLRTVQLLRLLCPQSLQKGKQKIPGNVGRYSCVFWLRWIVPTMGVGRTEVAYWAQ